MCISQRNLIIDDIDDIRKRKWKLASDMPDTFIATVISTGEHEKNHRKSLKLDLQADTNVLIRVTIRLPSHLTGKGQLDLFLHCLQKIDVPYKSILGKTFNWTYVLVDGALSVAIARSTAYLAFGSHEKAYTLAVIDFFGYFALKRGIKPKDD